LYLKSSWPTFYHYYDRDGSRGLFIGLLPPSCPSRLSEPYLYTSIVLTSVICAIVAFILAMLIIFRYNGVKIVKKRLKTHYISNSTAALYFLANSARSWCDAVQYGSLNIYSPLVFQVTISLLGLVMHAIGGLLLALVLNEHRRALTRWHAESNTGISNGGHRYNSGNSMISEYMSTGQRVLRLKSLFFSLEGLFFGLFVVLLLSLALKTIYFNYSLFFWIYLFCYLLQRTPILLLTVYILCVRLADGKESYALKSALFVGTLCNAVNDLPVPIWSALLSNFGCVFYICSLVDVSRLLVAVSWVAYFVFVVLSFRRQAKMFLWFTISRVQDSLDYRKF
jgi:hypothetical protein